MMKLSYRRAILSFCEDLTDPQARSIPVGVLLIADLNSTGEKVDALDGTRWAAAVVLQPGFVNPFVAEHLSDALAIVKEHIDHVLDEQPDAPSEDILHALYTMLRNSLFVSSIGEAQQAEVHAANEDLYEMAVVDVATAELKREFLAVVETLKQHAPRSSTAKFSTPVRAQQTEVWAL